MGHGGMVLAICRHTYWPLSGRRPWHQMGPYRVRGSDNAAQDRCDKQSTPQAGNL